MADISVIVCTHNPRRDYLHRVLDALNGQTLPKDNWELLVVDNAGNQRLADTWDLSWHARARHVREDNLGLTRARLCGITAACGEVLIFVDDDNVLASDFLEKASALYGQYPYLGAFGAGSVEPEFEIQPSSEIRALGHMLALRSVSSARWSNNAKDWGTIPWGPGLCVNRRVANLYRQSIGSLDFSIPLDRTGDALFSGGDDMFSLIAVSVGYGFGIFPQLRVTHLITSDRLNRRHLLRLINDHAYSSFVRHYLFDGIQPRRIDWTRYMRTLLYGIKNGQFSMRRQWAESSGQDRAARFILEKRLQPLQIAGSADPVSNISSERMVTVQSDHTLRDGTSAIQATASYLRERFAQGATDPRTIALYEELLGVLDVARRSIRLEREMADAAKAGVSVQTARERRTIADRRRHEDRRRVNLGGPSGIERRHRSDRRTHRTRRASDSLSANLGGTPSSQISN